MIKQALGAIFNPVSVVAVFAPVIMTLNLILLRSRVVDGSHVAELIDDRVFRAVLDYRTQFFTVIVALVFYIADNIRQYYRFGRDVPLSQFWTVLDGARWKQVNFALCGFFLFVVLYMLLTGFFADPEIILYYLRPDGPLEFGLVPPLESPLTWLRGLIVFAGISSAAAFADMR